MTVFSDGDQAQLVRRLKKFARGVCADERAAELPVPVGGKLRQHKRDVDSHVLERDAPPRPANAVVRELEVCDGQIRDRVPAFHDRYRHQHDIGARTELLLPLRGRAAQLEELVQATTATATEN